MKRLLSIAAVLALVAARPESYRETEDFNYSRSSTDEGAKSGFYNAQRGNMGGNYERAHNMDGLAQHQMSTAVKQVEGELGEASKMKTGEVFTSAHSGGMFGSGHYDVSNLHGRNFQENVGSASQSHSSLSSHNSNYDHLSSMHNSGYSHNSGYAQQYGSKTGQSVSSSNLRALDNMHGASYDYGTYGTGQSVTSDNLQAIDRTHGASYGYGTQGTAHSHSSGYSSQSGYKSHSSYDASNAANQQTHSSYGTNPQNRLIYATPVRIYGRPGSRIAVPVGVVNYDATHSASSVDENAINTNSEAEILSTGDQHITYKPSSNAKHYESSYNYRKQWEKHDVKPEVIALSVPTESPLPQNSELYEDTQASNNQYHASGFNSQSRYASNMHNAYNSNVKSSSASQVKNAATLSNLNANTHGAYNSGSSAEVLSGLDTKPKSYRSSFSYHKAWERQGDPYVIKPVGEGNQELQRLTAASSDHGYSSQHTGSNYHQTNQGNSQGGGLVCCEVPTNGYRRVARSPRGDDLQQQSRPSWGNAGNLEKPQGQQSEKSWSNLEDLGQQSQKSWGNLEDLGQQSQKSWSNMEDLGQQTQNSWNSYDALRHAQNQRLHQKENEFAQQVQQSQKENLQDFGQQAQNSWNSYDSLRQSHNQQTQIGQSKW